jgi:hypothetical protein
MKSRFTFFSQKDFQKEKKKICPKNRPHGEIQKAFRPPQLPNLFK